MILAGDNRGQWLIWNLTADIISTVEFDHTGNYLATGDKGGRVVLFERNETVRRLLWVCNNRLLMLCRKKPASTSSTLNSNLTNPNSTISSLSK